MQTITTKYSNGKIIAKSWNGSARVAIDHGLSSEENHQAAAEALIVRLNNNKDVRWGIHASAPSTAGGWCFIIAHVPAVMPLNMSITVKFIASTNTLPARMRVYSWVFPRGFTIYYGNWEGYEWDKISGASRYAADQMLEKINKHMAAECVPVQYSLGQYIETYDGDRVFSLVG